ncbi:MAG: tetratricopeptide repeat protein [Elusimicrobia bacterium]|nr:tetratricopeptide repeat protein [Elusimicrobiota bacterium]
MTKWAVIFTLSFSLYPLSFILYPLAFSFALPFRSRTQDAGFPGEWLTSFAAGAREAGMAGAAVAMPSARSAYSNPAGLAGGLGEAGFMAAPLFSGGHYEALSLSHPLGLGSYLGGALLYLGSGKAETTDSLGAARGSFEESDLAFLLGYAEQFSGQASAGLGFKFVRQSIAGYSSSGFGLDAGVMAKNEAGLGAGASLGNIIAPALKLKSEKEKFPLVLKAGPSYNFYIGRREFTAAAEVMTTKPKAGKFVKRWGLGLDSCLLPGKTPLFMRLGINQREYTAGFGMVNGPLSFDYAVALHELELAHRFGLSIRFGYLSPLAQKKIEAEWQKLREKEAQIKLALREGQAGHAEAEPLNEIEFASILGQARRLMAMGDLKQARLLLDKAAAVRGDDPSVKALRLEIEKREKEEEAVIEKQNARVFYGSKLYEEALKAAERALSLGGEDADMQILALMSKARLAIDQENYREAQIHLQKVVEINPELEEAVSLFRKVKNIAEAEEVLP